MNRVIVTNNIPYFKSLNFTIALLRSIKNKIKQKKTHNATLITDCKTCLCSDNLFFKNHADNDC